MLLSRFIFCAACLALVLPASAQLGFLPVADRAATLDSAVAALSLPDAPVSSSSMLPEAPNPQPEAQKQQPPLAAALPTSTPGRVTYSLASGQVYHKPTQGELARYYVHSTFGLPGQAAVLVRALFGQAVDTPNGWDQNWTGFGQRVGSNEGITFVNQTVKFGLSDAFHEDFRYFRCQGCTTGQKINNILLAEVTARHGDVGHRKFSITPIASHISGTVVAHELWYPDRNRTVGDAAGSVAVVLVTQIGVHVFEEFFLRHTEEKIPDKFDKYKKYLPGAVPPKPVTD